MFPNISNKIKVSLTADFFANLFKLSIPFISLAHLKDFLLFGSGETFKSGGLSGPRMKRIGKSGRTRIYGEPITSPVIKPQLENKDISGKKSKGWNLKYSSYKIFITLAYLVIRSPGGGKLEYTKHSYLIKGAVFNNKNVTKANWLETRLTTDLSVLIEEWVTQEEEEFSEEDGVSTAYHYPKRDTIKIQRV